MNFFKSKKKASSDQVFSQELLQQASDIDNIHQVHKKEVIFMILLINGSDIHELAELISKVANIAQKNDATIYSLAGPFIILSFGFLKSVDSNELSSCRRLAEELETQLGQRICGIYGQVTGGYGNLGCEQVALLGFLIPDFDKIINQLAGVPKGEILSIK